MTASITCLAEEAGQLWARVHEPHQLVGIRDHGLAAWARYSGLAVAQLDLPELLEAWAAAP